MAEEKPAPSWFAPVLLAGLGSAGLLTVVAAKPLFAADATSASRVGLSPEVLRADQPLALALALVVLAGWGVVLVTGTRVRRLMLALGLLATLGVIACLVTAPSSLPGEIRHRLPSGETLSTGPTTAYVVAWVAAMIVLASILAGWLLAPRWPRMSSRYDAPTAATLADAGADPRTEDADDLTLWKALDEGRDPTAR